MVRQSIWVVASVAACLGYLFPIASECQAQVRLNAGDRPNQLTPTDVSVGRMIDSIFEPDAPARVGSGSNVSRPAPSRKPGTASLQAKLVHNPNTRGGAPPYALVDRHGGILRYVEPVQRINLEPHVGKVVGVKHDTGDTLLATQLVLPQGGGAHGAIVPANFQEPIPAGEADEDTLLEPTPADANGQYYDESYSDDGIMFHDQGPIYLDGGHGLNFGSCPQCGDFGCSSHRGGRARSMQGRAYARGEYLLWWMDGMNTPPLVTTSTDPADGGVLPNPGQNDNPTTEILYGDQPLLENARSGGRILLGVWLDDCGKQALEGDYLILGDLTESFFAEGQDGDPIISRPFFDFFPVLGGPPQESAQEVSSDRLDGSILVNSRSSFQSAGVRLRHNLCRTGFVDLGCGDGIGCGNLIGGCGDGVMGCGSGVGGWGSAARRVDILTGVRWYQLREELNILEDLTVNFEQSPFDGTQFLVNDNFRTDNTFFGGELGFLWEIQRRRFSLELLTKMAIGNTRQRVAINGYTSTTDPGQATETEPGGLLAGFYDADGDGINDLNIGNYRRNRFSVIPEVGVNVGYQMTERLRFITGYSIIYWTNVVRPGDQIDRQVNSTLLPGVDPGDVEPIPLAPLFSFNDTNVLIQGLNIGAEYRW